MKNKNIFYTIMLSMSFCLFSCQGLVEGINEDPNSIPIEDIGPELFLSGAQLANISFQCGHLSRISALYSNQLFGFASVYGDIYRYNISTAESSSSWDKIYVGVVTNVRSIIENAPDDFLLKGICKVIEANAIGSAAAIFGDVPFTEINNPEIDDPIFNGQVDVLVAMQALLDDAISDLEAASSRPLPQDLHFSGDADMWIATAHSLKAKYHLLRRHYPTAYASAGLGISSDAGSLQYVPRGTEASVDDKNQFWTTLNGARGGDIGSGDSYLTQLLDPSSSVYRGNAKTDETARSGYAYVNETDGISNFGIIEGFEPQDIVSYAENILTLAECGARANGFDVGLGHLNEYRAWLNTGAHLNSNFDTLAYNYEAYTADDFAAGGMENMDNMDPLRALLREIVEERYVSGFLTWMPFDDHRRLRKEDGDIVVPFEVNDPSASGHVQRLPYPSNELNANSNAPADDPGIFTKTEVNQ